MRRLSVRERYRLDIECAWQWGVEGRGSSRGESWKGMLKLNKEWLYSFGQSARRTPHKRLKRLASSSENKGNTSSRDIAQPHMCSYCSFRQRAFRTCISITLVIVSAILTRNARPASEYNKRNPDKVQRYCPTRRNWGSPKRPMHDPEYYCIQSL